jgi:DNA mismatch repair protein MLH1
VESTAVKRAIEQTYSAFLPKGGHPFIYLDLEIEPQRVDVNVHPTKREVNFLNEDEIVEMVCSEIRSKLAQVDESRTFLTQTLLPGVQIETIQPGPESALTGEGAASSKTASTPKTPATSKRPYENNLVRTDSKVRKITSMLTQAPISSPSHFGASADAGAPASSILDDGLLYEITDRQPLSYLRGPCR